MRLHRNSVAIGAVALILAGVGLPALGQDKPESILPPGFGTPAPAPAPTPSSTAQPTPSAANPLGLSILPVAAPSPTPTPTPSPTPTDSYAAMPSQYELPAFARRSLAQVGATGSTAGGLAANAFGNADGHYLETLMRRLDAPIASRWLEIGLRRALASRIDTPASLNGADFAAERAWLLLRMGESVVARGVVQNVDADNYTAKLLQVAMQVALATGDPAALCPLAPMAARFSPTEPGWMLAQAMCAGLAGEPEQADSLLRADRRQGIAGGIDLRLAEKVLGAGLNGRREVTIEWTGVDQLNAWRYGLATATGADIPDTLFDTVESHVRFWRALSPTINAAIRAPLAERAAVRGVFSNAALVDLYGEIDLGDNQGSAEDGIARDLRSAYVDADQDGRMRALGKLWDDPSDADGRYARLVLTARAASRITPADNTKDADRLVASMLTAGLDRAAMRWMGHVDRGSAAWAMLTLADPDPAPFVSRGAANSFGDDDPLKKRMFIAGLAGLGRMSSDDIESAARSADIKIGAENSWTRALDRAVQAKQPGTVMLLAGVGMQTGDWHAVSPEALYRIVAALNVVGLNGQARMIAAEAIARA